MCHAPVPRSVRKGGSAGLHVFFLAALLLLLMSVARIGSAQEAGPFILGTGPDAKTARQAGLAGRFVLHPQQVPDRADVYVLGPPERPGGIDEISYLNLVGRGCRALRLGTDPAVTLAAVLRRAAERQRQGQDPFRQISLEVAAIHHPRLAASLRKAPRGLAGQPVSLAAPATGAPGGGDDPLAPPRPGPSALGARLEADRRVVLFLPFPADQATLGPRANPFLYRLLELLFDRPGLRLAIHGHAEAAAGAEAAQRLSQERAQAVKDWLVKFGIPATRLQAVGHGATQPLAVAGADPGMGRVSRIEIVKDQ